MCTNTSAKAGCEKKNLRAFLEEHNKKRATKRQGPALDPDDALHAVYQKEQGRCKIPREVILTRWLGCLQAVSCITSSLEVYREFFTWEAGKLTGELHHERDPEEAEPPPLGSSPNSPEPEEAEADPTQPAAGPVPDARRRSMRNRYAAPINYGPVANTAAAAGAAANAPAPERVKNLEKAADIRDLLQDNEIVSWFWYLTDVLPVLTNMNLLFQATLPLPHKLFEKVWGARKGLCDMVGQRPCAPEFAVMKEADVTHNTKFGVFAERFLSTYGAEEGNEIRSGNVRHLKLEWRDCCEYMADQLDERFPFESMEVYQLVQVVDPRLWETGNFGAEMTAATALSELLRMFEIPLYGIVDLPKVLASFQAFKCSNRTPKLIEEYLRMDPKTERVDESKIYDLYWVVVQEMPESKDWAVFCLFMLVLTTGNAISERGFSAMSNVHTKSRSQLSVKQCRANMIISFNGASYQDFANRLNAESLEKGKTWWGFVDNLNAL